MLSDRYRLRLIEVRDYVPKRTQPRECIYRPDDIGQTLLSNGLLEVEARFMKLPGMTEPARIAVCRLTLAGKKKLLNQETTATDDVPK